MKALMRKIDKLNNEMISKHDVPSCKRKEIKRFTRWALFSPNKNIA
jgi:ribosomal protein L37AE/L43A